MHSPADYLELARAASDGSVLRQLARRPHPFVWRAVAANPHTPAIVLLELCAARSTAWSDNELLHLLARHPQADRAVLLAVLNAAAEKLTEGERPYAAVLALAERIELTTTEVSPLGALPGASARLRRGLAHRLTARP
ncbi:hypothetical protein E1265_07120 [Streptomyces sp. 8K308]|uniref:hypothetical protein n=1 Tax=Streptomyces sp. 8K308 TaxID=2530388 RepID=UPI00104315C5|nr:hypothetical protein [Streptomyces sp. 8K308]TDC25419.1 hypothetical protein E1265_07120 [Streptomyces sp. 8K308]